MAKALFLYSSREGQTKKIFHYIEEQLTDFECELVDLHNVETIDFSQYEKVLIGASIRYGHLNKKLYQFIERNLTQLEQN
ncbi:protoporphyrinogen oxidase, partial [Vibrio parahaemolyticus]